MSINSISFLTPISNINDKDIVLDKKYSKTLTLKNGSSISLSSDVGRKRKQEDSLAISHKDDITLLLISDGVGGMECGEIASYMIAKEILEWFESEDIDLLKNLNKINTKNILLKRILLVLMQIPNNSGTTLNMSIILPKSTIIINIGDSRTYTIKNDQITLRTCDDSLAFEQLDLSTEDARNKLRFYRQNNIITKLISPMCFPKLKITMIQNDDYDIICHVTDGVSDILTESEIGQYCKKEDPATTLIEKSVYQPDIYSPDETCDEYYSNVIHPGKDNSTAIVYTKKRTKVNI